MAPPENDNGEGPVIRDKRRVDPETGELRTPEGEGASEAPAADAGAPEAAEGAEEPSFGDEVLAALASDDRVNELTADLKRLQAEYANYRKRVDRDRESVKEQARAQVLGELLPILDDIGRARDHEELTGGFKSVGEGLEALVGRLGLRSYGAQGDEFDPTVHEALTFVPQPGADSATVIEVFQPGYLIGERVLRPARVVVGGPADEEDGAPAAAAPEGSESDPDGGGADAEGSSPSAGGKDE